jgi:plasmid stabilization system protein ParE
MSRRVITAPTAAKGLRDARIYLTQPGSGPGGRQKWENIRDARRQLRERPYIGPQSPEHPGCRCLVREGYRIVYEISPDTGSTETAGDVTVLAVFPPGIGNRDLR